jgi:signal transduction histidine kinase
VCQATPSADGLSVFDGDHLLARVITTSPAVADQPTAYAVIAAVRLAVVNRRLHDQQAQRVADVEASRARLLAAADRERQRVAARLRTEAGASLERARAKLAAARTEGDPELSGRIEFASSEVAAAATEVQRIVAGVPPTALGAGSLHGAIAALAARSPAKVTLNLADDAAADTAAETTLFYVCSEALANASKHAGATHVVIDLQRHDDRLLLSVHDDGRGGADTAGSGLQGLADRLAAAGGHLTIDSPPGGGTTVTAAVPQRS